MLIVSRIDVFYDQIQALHGVSFEVRQGEIVTLIGSNGAGKSTTLMTLSGLLNPSSGSIIFEERNLLNIAAHQRVEAGLVQCPEGRRVFSEMSVEENLRLGAYARSDKAEIKSDIENIFAMFERLRERRNQSAGTLSGGEQQMLAIGRALLGRPALLLLDEPSLGLAPLLVREIFRKLQDIRDAGVTILLVEQNAHLALEIADRAYVLETGRVVMEGAASEIASSPRVKEAYLGA
jgi:branched-chain amino acid transport system ATP-binding protein